MEKFVIGTILGIAALVAAPLAVADGTETLGPPSVSIASGTGVVAAGVGTEGFQNTPRSFTVEVPAGAIVKQVLFYWGGRFEPVEGTDDNAISINGNPVTGTSIGGPSFFYTAPTAEHPGSVYHRVFRADVTGLGLVAAGVNTLTIADMAFVSILGSIGNVGAGVFVVYDSGGPASTIGIRDGLDLAYINFPPPRDTTVPQTFSFAPSGSPRTATLSAFAGSVFNPNPEYGFRTSRISVSFDLGGIGDVVIDNPWQSLQGEQFDASNLNVTVPAGASQMTVQALSSGPDGAPGINTPASIAWMAAAVSVPDARGRVRVEKTVAGQAPTGTDSFTFELRQGASMTSVGTVLETASANAGNGGSFVFADRDPGTYQFCELDIPAAWHSSLSDSPGAFRPNSANDPQGDNSLVCVGFTLGAGEAKTFTVENTPPPHGDARTIGYWKNWSSCSGGRQGPVLDETLASTGGVALGSSLTLTTCVKAVRILMKSTVDTGAKKASDPAFNLAAQLLAAKLSVARGALACSAANTAVANAGALLGAVAFSGKSTWKNTMNQTQRTKANTLATKLDTYTNNELC